MRSEVLGLLCKGEMDFSGNLLFDIVTQFSPEFIKRYEAIRKLIASIISTATNQITIKLTGTLEDPKYSLVPTSIDLIQKTGSLIFKGLQNMLESPF